MGRSIGAIAAGFVLVVVLSIGADILFRALFPGSFDAAGRSTAGTVLLVTLGYVTVFAITGAYLTARLAPNRPLGHALTLGAIAFILSLPATIAAWDSAPVWYHIGALALILPASWLGGRLREGQLGMTSRGRGASA
jgi:hypothetical protein